MTSSTSETDVIPLLYSERSGKRSSQSRSEDSKVRSKAKCFDRSGSNSLKRPRGSDNTASERTKSVGKDAKRGKASHSSSAAEKRSYERRHSTEDEPDVVALSYLNTTGSKSNGQSSNTGKKAISVARKFGESHLGDDGEQLEEVEQTSAQIKHCGKRGIRKKMSGDSTKKVKSSPATKKDSSWKQNSRSRRLVANARERSRIHILSDAFENLRRAVPSYSHDQKLSKLAILKLATYYISALSNLAESDTSARSLKQFADCVSHCTNALQTEGRSRRKNF
ncbi:basic helix-loop-helix transcription factor amos-like [Dendronephthya gigantea]|uniref:basic helix-loop-helix transcription factor amos-like n=1 Tax=Dendronephthya gigantea TaxID=151771 RepID=UPI00106949DF|nr:basic helix-loop-helix transcription factor amos-like [Dendronephthya gigantea]